VKKMAKGKTIPNKKTLSEKLVLGRGEELVGIQRGGKDSETNLNRIDVYRKGMVAKDGNLEGGGVQL